MKIYGTKIVRHQVLKAVKCDVCKKEYSSLDIEFELQEFQHIKFRGGYASVFGDDNLVECDICQHCLLKLIGDYARIEDPEDR